MTGTSLGKKFREQLTEKIKRLSGARPPTLAIVQIGDHAASTIYVKKKKEACKEVGIRPVLFQFAPDLSVTSLLDTIERLNKDPQIDGILVQLPLPPHLDQRQIAQAVHPQKDVDGLHPLNMGKLLLGDPSALIPCTPYGIQALLKHYTVETEGKEVVVVGRSVIVGKPMAALFMQNKPGANSTVTVVHSKTPHLFTHTRRADILIVAVGKAHFVTEDMVKPGSTVIDVGINRTSKGRILGDVDFVRVKTVCQNITPVPGGVGPMTVAMLLKNTFKAYLLHEA